MNHQSQHQRDRSIEAARVRRVKNQMTPVAGSDRTQSSPMATTRGLRERLRDPNASSSVVAVIVISAIVLLVLLSGRVDDPPFWDASFSTSVSAAELARNGFDIEEVLAAPGYLAGEPGTHASSLLTPVLGMLFVLFGSSGGLIAGHLLMIVMGSALVGATFALARRYLSIGIALLVAVVVMIFPVILQQVADPYVEIPLALFAVLTVMAVLDGSRPRAVLFAALAVWFKATGLMLVPLLAMMGHRAESRRWLRNGIAVLITVLPLSLRLMSPSNLIARDVQSTGEGTILLLRSATVIIGSTIDVLLVLALFLFGSMRLRERYPALVWSTSVVTSGFAAIVLYTIVFTHGVSFLPRYYVALLPLWLLVVAIYLRTQHHQRVVIGVLSMLAVFSIVNWDGRLYPLSDHPHPVMAERSVGGAKEYLELEVAGTRALAELSDSVDVLVLGREMWFRFRYPELGYIREAPHNVIRVSEVVDLPDTFAWLDEPYPSGFEDQLMDLAEQGGWVVEVLPISHGRWTSDLVVARK